MQNKTKSSDTSFPISRKGLLLIAFSILLIILGYALMWGEGSNADSFNPEIFSVSRIVVAPACCLVGYLLVIAGIVLLPSSPEML